MLIIRSFYIFYFYGVLGFWGFGTFLNKNEIDKLIKYSSNVEFWNNLYNIELDNKPSINLSLGTLKLNHKLFHPRLFNSKFYNYNDLNLDDGVNMYNILDDTNYINNIDDYKEYYKEYYNGYIELDFIRKLPSIDTNGSIKPFQKWVIEAAYNMAKNNSNLDIMEII